MDKICLPKRHLSWSQMQIWETNKDRYRREYFEKGRKLDTRELRFGRGIAEMIEKGLHKELLPNLPIYPRHEHEIRAFVLGVPILSYLDGDGDDDFGEYKTGKIAWTQAKVQKHEQLAFYAVAKKAECGRMPKRCTLHWIETTDAVVDAKNFWERVDKKIRVTGQIKSFERIFDEREIERMEKKILRVAQEITKEYLEFINNEF